MQCFTFDEGKLTKGIAHEIFYSPLFSGTIENASLRLVTGGSWDLKLLAEAVKSGVPHAFLCCLVELIPPTGNKSTLFPENTCLLAIKSSDVDNSPADNSVLFASEGMYRLYGCLPDKTFIRVGDKQIVHKDDKLQLIVAPPVAEQITDPYHQYRGQDIAVLELL